MHQKSMLFVAASVALLLAGQASAQGYDFDPSEGFHGGAPYSYSKSGLKSDSRARPLYAVPSRPPPPPPPPPRIGKPFPYGSIIKGNPYAPGQPQHGFGGAFKAIGGLAKAGKAAGRAAKAGRAVGKAAKAGRAAGRAGRAVGRAGKAGKAAGRAGKSARSLGKAKRSTKSIGKAPRRGAAKAKRAGKRGSKRRGAKKGKKRSSKKRQQKRKQQREREENEEGGQEQVEAFSPAYGGDSFSVSVNHHGEVRHCQC